MRGRRYLAAIALGAALALCGLAASARAQRDLPSTESFMNALGTCAAGMRLNFSADVVGSIRSFYEGARTQGSGKLENVPEFLVLLPESERLAAYQVYVGCVTRIVGLPEVSQPPKRDMCVSAWADCKADSQRGSSRALRSCQRYVDCDPDDSWPHLVLGDELLDRNEMTAAEIQFQRVVSLGQRFDNPGAIGRGYRGLARLQVRQQRPDEAFRLLELAMKFSDQSDDTDGMAMNYREFGNLHRRLGNIDKARPALEKALSLFEKRGLPFGLGTAHAELGLLLAPGDKSAGCAHFRKARALFVEDQDVRYIDVVDGELARFGC